MSAITSSHNPAGDDPAMTYRTAEASVSGQNDISSGSAGRWSEFLLPVERSPNGAQSWISLAWRAEGTNADLHSFYIHAVNAECLQIDSDDAVAGIGGLNGG